MINYKKRKLMSLKASAKRKSKMVITAAIPVACVVGIPVGVYAAEQMGTEAVKTDMNIDRGSNLIADVLGEAVSFADKLVEAKQTEENKARETVETEVEGMDIEVVNETEYMVKEETEPETEEIVEDVVEEETETEIEPEIETETEVVKESSSGGTYSVEDEHTSESSGGYSDGYVESYEKYADNGTYVRYSKITGLKPKIAVAGEGCYSKASVYSMAKANGARVAINGSIWEGSGHPSGTTFLNGYVWSYLDGHYNNGDNLVMYHDGTLDSVYVDRYNVWDLGVEWSLKGNIVITSNGARRTEYYNVGRHPYTWIVQDWDGTYYLGENGGRGYEGCGMNFDEIHNFVMNKVSSNARFIYVLDGGGSTAYYLNGDTQYGWGRNVPNIIYF